jgi:predicted  nucleic acid-binding Zn-ribbon protein
MERHPRRQALIAVAIDEERVRRLTAEYNELAARQQVLLDELREVQLRLGEIMLQIIDVTRQ